MTDSAGAETLYVEHIGAKTFTALWEQNGRLDHRVLFPIEMIESDDLLLFAEGVELYWSFARPGEDRLAVRRVTPPTGEQLARYRSGCTARPSRRINERAGR